MFVGDKDSSEVRFVGLYSVELDMLIRYVLDDGDVLFSLLSLFDCSCLYSSMVNINKASSS